MKKIILLLIVCSFQQSFASGAHGRSGLGVGSIENQNNGENEAIMANNWQICVNHRVSTKGETITVAGAWCDQYFIRVDYQEPA